MLVIQLSQFYEQIQSGMFRYSEYCYSDFFHANTWNNNKQVHS